MARKLDMITIFQDVAVLDTYCKLCKAVFRLYLLGKYLKAARVQFSGVLDYLIHHVLAFTTLSIPSISIRDSEGMD